MAGLLVIGFCAWAWPTGIATSPILLQNISVNLKSF